MNNDLLIMLIAVDSLLLFWSVYRDHRLFSLQKKNMERHNNIQTLLDTLCDQIVELQTRVTRIEIERAGK